MLLQTNLVGRLADNGFRIAIVSLNPDDQNFEPFHNDPRVVLIKWNERSDIWDDNYLFKRAYFLENINANPALKEKFYNGLFYSDSRHPWKRLRPLYYYLIYRLIKYFPAIRQKFRRDESKYLESAEARRIINQINPQLVISTYPVSIIEAKMLHAANEKGIRTSLQLLSWDNITAKGRFPALADHYLAWGVVMKQELIENYQLPEERITITGVPHFDLHVQVRQRLKERKNSLTDSITKGKPYLFFAMSSPRFSPREIEIVEWLAAKVSGGAFGDDLNLLIRPHPQNVKEFTAKESWLHRLDKLNNDRVTVNYPRLNESLIRWSMQKDDMDSLSEIIGQCSICLNSGSTVSIDALFHNKPVILTSFDGAYDLSYWNSARRLVDYTHLKKYCDMGGAQVVRSYSELEDTIRQYLKEPDRNLKGRRSALYGQCYLDDGKSTERAVKAIEEILSEK